eukprot:9323191-Alexandrium_andersonii.AAC.1
MVRGHVSQARRLDRHVMLSHSEPDILNVRGRAACHSTKGSRRRRRGRSALPLRAETTSWPNAASPLGKPFNRG